MIELQGLEKSYGAFAAVKNLSFQVARGEVYGFLGPNGAGKTTTLRMLMGMLRPTGGSARIDGLDCQVQATEVKNRVGYLPDVPIFYDFLRGREILEFVGEMQGLDRKRAVMRAGALLEELGLADATEEFAINYSMGMKKRLGLAMALIHDPAVLILDEPTNGLDPRASRDIQAKLREAAQAGKTVLLSTHLLDMAEKLCTRLGIIHHGALIAEGTVAELRERVVPGGTLEEVFLKATDEETPS